MVGCVGYQTYIKHCINEVLLEGEPKEEWQIARTRLKGTVVSNKIGGEQTVLFFFVSFY
jgi:hypothetical protein